MPTSTTNGYAVAGGPANPVYLTNTPPTGGPSAPVYFVNASLNDFIDVTQPFAWLAPHSWASGVYRMEFNPVMDGGSAPLRLYGPSAPGGIGDYGPAIGFWTDNIHKWTIGTDALGDHFVLAYDPVHMSDRLIVSYDTNGCVWLNGNTATATPWVAQLIVNNTVNTMPLLQLTGKTGQNANLITCTVDGTGTVFSVDGRVGTSIGTVLNSNSASIPVYSSFTNGVRGWQLRNTATTGLFQLVDTNTSGIPLTVDGNDNVGINEASPLNRLTVTDTTTQLRLGYDNNTNYMTITVGSTGIATIDNVGAGASCKFNDPVGFAGTAVAGDGGSFFNPVGIYSSKALLLQATSATAGAQNQSAGSITQRGRYWTGAASADINATLAFTMTGAPNYVGTWAWSIAAQTIMQAGYSVAGGRTWGVFGTNAAQQTGGAATAGAAYGATEQTMLQKAYDALRTFGMLS